MTDIVLYTGVGGSWSPHVPYLDALLCKQLRKKGVVGRRTGKLSQHASVSYKQALDYARDSRDDHVFQLIPQRGNTLTWVPKTKDMVLSFETFCADLFWDGHRCPVLRDAHGSLDILETYLSMRRQINAITRLVDRYLRDVTPQEHVCTGDDDLASILGDHDGEVWITGKCPRVVLSNPPSLALTKIISVPAQALSASVSVPSQTFPSPVSLPSMESIDA